MKRYFYDGMTTGVVYVMNSADALSFWRALEKAVRRGKTDLYPAFVGRPVFVDSRMYGIMVDDVTNTVTVLGANTVLYMVVNGDLS